MATATWNGATIAESDDILVVEGNLYFPRAAVRDEYITASEHTSVCGWKGTANYFDLTVAGQHNHNAA